MDVKYDDFFDDAATPVQPEASDAPEAPEKELPEMQPTEEQATSEVEINAAEETGVDEDFGISDELDPVVLPFPAEELDENGRVKRVRKRVLKKLLKYEFRYLLPVLLGAVALLQLFAIFFGIQMRTVNEEQVGWIVLAVLLYVYGNIGLLGIAIGMPERRYTKNFFKNEGYVTFSIPASAEEHILAKRLSAIIEILIANAGIFLGIMIAGTIIGGGSFYQAIGEFFSMWGAMFRYETAHAIFFTLEGLLILVLGLPLLPSVCGAMACFMQKFSDKKRFAVTLAVTFGIVAAVQTVTVFLATTGFFELFSIPAGIHIFLWLIILFEAGIIALCLWYELRTLKHKLNLK